MKIRSNTLKTVGFVMWHDHRTNTPRPAGTFFFLGRDQINKEPYPRRMWAVTARHVIDGLRRRGATEAILRINTKAGRPLLKSASLEDWYAHSLDNSIDVAIFEMGIDIEMDQLVMARNQCVNPEAFRKHDVGLGDEIFVAGLFHHHFGKERNIPIIRVGNLIAFNEERVETRMGDIEAHLVECRSIGGLSGSPVFLNLGTHRIIRGKMQESLDRQPITLLLGLMHGHFDVAANEIDLPLSAEEADTQKINAGVGIVVPSHCILAVVDEYERAHPAP